MPAQIFGTDAVVIILNRAFNDASPSNATFKNQVAAAGTTEDSQYAFAKTFGAGYAGQTADALSTLILGNLGVLPNTALQTALKDYLTSVGVANVGIVALQLGQILSNLENATGDQAVFKAAAAAWNNEVTAAYNYSANPANTGPSGPGNAQPGNTFTLTANADTLEPSSAVATSKTTAGDDVIRALNSDSTNANNTLNTSDVIDGGAGNDTLNVELASSAGAYTAKPVLKNVETINVTTKANAAAVTLDLSDSTGVTALVSKAGSGAAQKSFTASGLVLGTAVTLAGDHTGATVTAGFAGVTGGSDAASVTLNKAVGNGVLVLDGIETINVASTGSANAVTLNGTTVETINLTGSFSTTLTVGAAAAGQNTVKTIDASAATGNFSLGALTAANDVTVKGSTGNNVLEVLGTKKATITTQGGNDAIKIGNTGVSTVDSGAGNDEITITAAAKHLVKTGAGNDTVIFGDNTSVAANATTIQDFTSGSDKIKLTGLTDNAATPVTAVITSQANLTAIQVAVDSLAADKVLADALTAAYAITATKDLGYFTFKGDTYVFVEETAAGHATDTVIKLTGAVSLASGDFVLA